jgi:predicted anti-sigma-YlaC factor YlaD
MVNRLLIVLGVLTALYHRSGGQHQPTRMPLRGAGARAAHGRSNRRRGGSVIVSAPLRASVRPEAEKRYAARLQEFPEGRRIVSEVQVLRLGELAFVSAPGELVAELDGGPELVALCADNHRLQRERPLGISRDGGDPAGRRTRGKQRRFARHREALPRDGEGSALAGGGHGRMNKSMRNRLSLGLKMTHLVLVSVVGISFTSGCSIKKVAVNKLADALSMSGSTFTSDEDAELVKAALPFGLKLMESLLAENPKHKGLLFATSSYFTQYSYAFVQQEAEKMEDKDLAASEQMRTRARNLYVRARGYGLRALELNYPGFEKALRANPRSAVRMTRAADVPQLYWTAVSWALAISPDNPVMIAELPIVEALIDRALELNESYADGAIHSFLIVYEMGRPGAVGDPAARSREHFQRSMVLSRGEQAAPLVSFAEAVCVKKQDWKEFESLLNRALAIDPNKHPESRLSNIVMQQRARWLLSRRDELFLLQDAK